MRNLKIGVFGLMRGKSHIKSVNLLEGAEICAICDRDEEVCAKAKELCSDDVKVFTDWDSFIHSGMDVAVLANFFHEHAKCAIEAMELGIDVISECTAAATMQECADLCRAVERTGRTYCLAENGAYELGPLEMRRVFRTGVLGAPVYGEGEYVHPTDRMAPPSWNVTSEHHWRNYCPATYYLTHSIGPIMYVTDAEVKRVIGKTAPFYDERTKTTGDIIDGTGMMLCEMSDGSLFRFCGCSAYAPHENWRRIACVKGCCETVRGDVDSVRVAFNPWSTPEDWDKPAVYKQEVESEEELERMKDTGHGGIDYRMMKEIVADLREGRQPYFDVYRAVNMSAAAILGWRSVLNDSAQQTLPDFRDEESRKICDGDTATPFPDMNGNGDVIPHNFAKLNRE